MTVLHLKDIHICINGNQLRTKQEKQLTFGKKTETSFWEKHSINKKLGIL